MNYYSTIHTLELIYFDSNTQETMKNVVVSFRFFQLSAIALKKVLTLTQAFTRMSYVFKAQNDVTPSNVKTDMVDGKDDLIKRRQIASHISAHWFVAE